MVTTESLPPFLGQNPLRGDEAQPDGDYVEMLGETYYRISHVDRMPTFLMSLVSGADHWLFIASNGGLTAGRTNVNSALFPYETEDKLMANREQTGSKTLLQVADGERGLLWTPLSGQYAGLYACERHLYKNIPGNKLIFEEINHDLGLTWRMAWRTGDRFGFVRTCWLINHGSQPRQIRVLDGLQNLLPYGANITLQTNMSSLLNGYKRSELDPQSGLGIFALSATLTDQAEPSESLMATVAWQVGLADPLYLLSNQQVNDFCQGRPVATETDVRGRVGAYLVHADLALAPGESHAWHVVADVNQDGAAVADLARFLVRERATLAQQIEADIDANTGTLVRRVAAADGLQHSAQTGTTAHHFANVLFNVMRGGVFSDAYQVTKVDLIDFVATRHRPLLTSHKAWFADLPDTLPIHDLYSRAAAQGSPDLIRLCYEYLPLAFSRRHGDPSRPWNQFSINLKQPDGSPRLDYQGNWRDIFQNWEPMALAFPAYTPGMIAKFLNATTPDGYNPYRITRDGIEWEVPEPHNPWSNIGYWSDHQIIYLQKLLEIGEAVEPGMLARMEQQPTFAYANVPYRIKPYEAMLADWYNTIDFDEATDARIARDVERMGTDARLLRDAQGQVIHASLTEKLLTLLLAKLTNFVPGGGIWMNTQRPEWNDANNALVGKGISVVTTAYLRRFIAFWQDRLAGEAASFQVNQAVAALLRETHDTLAAYADHLEGGFDDRARRLIMDALGQAATRYRSALYQEGLPQEYVALSRQDLADFLTLAQAYVDQTLHANRRDDGLYHAYNILALGQENGEACAAVAHLYPMLEGQVAILSAGLLRGEEALHVLHGMRHSALYRADQHSYMLYPNRELPGFLSKNNLPAAKLADSKLVAALMARRDPRLLVQDGEGTFHFNGRFRNAQNVAEALDRLAQEEAYADLVPAERDTILRLFEEIFNHQSFTGRSGTFFAYEGLGSIYWHMVAKLLLAVQEVYMDARAQGEDPAILAGLADAYNDIRAGLGFNKTPAVYGAFPADPYSHTPWGRGAQQPGMTGQVKEEILTRWGELGVSVQAGQLHFAPSLLHPDEFLAEPGIFRYVDIHGHAQELPLPPDSLAFTFCQVPICYRRASAPQVTLHYADGRSVVAGTDSLDPERARPILDRDGSIHWVAVDVALG